MAADLFAQLWPASYKGVPFWIEHDDEEGGRRLDVAEFPYSNTFFVENLGQKAKRFRVTAYLVDDDYIADAAALGAACDGDGAGTLVLPTQGPVQAHCAHFQRARAKDRIGHIAFEAEFVLDGAATPVQSVDYSAQLALDAAASAGDAATVLASHIQVAGMPSWVAAGVVEGLQTIVATLDMLRTGTGNVDPTQSQALEGQLATLYNAIPAAVSVVGGLDTSIVPTMVAVTQAIAASMPPATAADVFGAAADTFVQPVPAAPTQTANAHVAASNAGLIARLARFTLMAATLAAVVDTTFDSRPEGINAKVLMVYRFDRELELCFGADDQDLYVALQTLRNTGVAYLETLITTLAPILTVSTGVSIPSLVAAWTLYQDPARARELVLRNDVKHPSFMPLTFEALAPAVAA